MQCPGCGMQRSFIALLKGDFKTSLDLYPALMPLLILLLFFAFHLRYRFSFGKKFIIFLQVLVVVIVTTHYIYKIATNQIFQIT